MESCSSQAWTEQWKWRWWKVFWYRGMDGYSEADEYGKIGDLQDLETYEIWSEKVGC